MTGRAVIAALYLLSIPLLFRPFWPETHAYEALNWTLFLGASVALGFLVARWWALALPWVIDAGVVIGVALYIVVLNASEPVPLGDGPASGIILFPIYGFYAVVADAAIAVGVSVRRLIVRRQGG